MKKYILFTMFAVSMIGLSLTSCTDSFLDHDPDERTEIDTPEKAIKLLTACYPDANYGWVCELSSDNIMDLNSEHLPASLNSEQKTTHYNLSSYGRQDDELFRFEPVKSSTSSDTPAALWNSDYQTINTINEVLQAIDKMIANGEELTPKLKAARAEALLLRSYTHFILVNVFSQAYKNDELSRQDVGVPYVTEPMTKVDSHFERGNVTETYNKIREDLETALKDISDVNFEMVKWHFNVSAAHAYAARFYLYTRQWDKVIEHANAVLGTDNTQLLPKLFDYSPLDDCMYLDDFANVWQSPYIFNNILLMDSYSTIVRHAGYRYEQGSTTARAIYYHNSPLWRGWIANPTIFVSGLFGARDYGWYPSWIGEQFQYTDKVAGIGYAHSIRREFWAAELLLERAEAKIMMADYQGASDDLCTYHASTMNFSETNKNVYMANNNMIPMTDEIIHSWFATDRSGEKYNTNYNCFNDWNFVTNMSPDYVIPAEAVPYMNCLNYWRRFETNYTGLRFFDLKRWGMEWTHIYGPNNEEIRMTWNDPRKALEVPQDAIAAGLEPSRPVITTDQTSTEQRVSYEAFWQN